MALKTAEQYMERLFKMRKNIYINGQELDRLDPRLQPGINIIKETFKLAAQPEWQELCTATSHLTGETVNRFCHIHQNKEDLLKKQKMTRMLGQRVGGCIQRCMGTDSMNALSVVTKEMDDVMGMEYHQRFLNFLKYFQENDLVGCCAQTDVKGDRSKRPNEQPDPDLYLRIVEEREDGIVVRGAKAHNTAAPYADEIIVIPTRFMTDKDAPYAVAFAVPGDHPGVKMVVRPALPRTREATPSPIFQYGDVESFTIFDDVFVPKERVFMKGEFMFAGFLALMFAHFHRHSYTGCKPAVSDVLASAAALVAEYSGLEKAHYVREKISHIIGTAELVYATGIASAEASEKFASGTQVPDEIYTNVGRRHAGHNIYHEYEILADLAGGLCATMPFEDDFDSENGELLRKYMQRAAGVPVEDIIRCYRLVEHLTVGDLSGVMQVAGIHGGGSPQMETIALMQRYPLKKLKGVAKYLAGIDTDFTCFERGTVTPKQIMDRFKRK
ncbi:4-hydroxyphenylacetate 3-hydroxylase N-terminal domain-containing protein [Desulfoscipio sp. XC116]|uniref:4-hydroxyphenylacetate 3-hydroxylase family protein n=1 Tax=Desulfoscipio sp. XC116 TaxID=3144975 RepID=UPI00325B1F2C